MVNNLFEILNSGGVGVEVTDSAKKIQIGNDVQSFQVFKIDLSLLFYNDQNDRIATWLSKYKSENNLTEIDKSDTENYNSIIEKFIVESNPKALDKTLRNMRSLQQLVPGVVLPDGRIIDGNRRFSCLRKLYREDPLRFDAFEACILPDEFVQNKKKIKLLELQLQIGTEDKVDYNPIDRLVGVYNDLVKEELLTTQEYVMTTNMSENEVQTYIELSKLMIEFLEYINCPEQFHIARDLNLDGPLRELLRILKKFKGDEKKKQEYKTIVFNLLLIKPTQAGDLTRYIRKIQEIPYSTGESSFIESQLDIAEQVQSKIIEKPKITLSEIGEIRTDEKFTKIAHDSYEKTLTQAYGERRKDQPGKLLDRCYDTISQIDINVFKKLDEEELGQLLKKAEDLEGKIKEIKDLLNNV